MKVVISIGLFCLWLPFSIYGQKKIETLDKYALVEQRIESISERMDENSEVDYTTLFDDFLDLLDNPLNLNNANADDLGRLQLLSATQINNLLSHISRFGPLLSEYELQVIDGFDIQTIALIYPFIQIKERSEFAKTSFLKMLSEGDNEVMARYRRILQEQEGYTPISAEELEEKPNSRYLGNRDQLYMRYRYKFKQNISYGFVAEKDPGEEFFTGSQKPNLDPNNFKSGFDFLSGHFYLSNMGKLKKLAIGDFQAQFGQGLTFWSGLAFSNKSAYSMNLKRSARGIVPYTSVNENLFLRGAAATLAFGKIEISPFASYKGLDANIISEPDSLNENQAVAVSSFQQSGFHRTPAEMEDRKAIKELITGANIAYVSRTFNVGLTAARTQLEGNLQRDLPLYNQFDLNNNINSNLGIDYNFIWRNFNFFGEAAISQSGGTALLNGALIAIDPKLSMSILHRRYERDYQNLYSTAIGESTENANESGLYMGIELKPLRNFRINAFFDQFWFPWLRYQVDAPSNGFDYLLQATYKPSKKIEVYARWRNRKRPKNTIEDAPISYVESTNQHNLRFNLNYQVSPSVQLRSRVEYISYQRDQLAREQGFMIYQDVVYKALNFPVSFSLRYAMFETDSYNARMYAYESEVLYYYAIPPYYGTGSRAYALVHYKVNRQVEFWLRYGIWVYTDRNEVGSGLETSQGPTRSDFKAQVRVKF
jgi:hypothetical protein